jgi:hypothetical protein
LIPLENLIKPDWIHIPVRPVIRQQKQYNYYGYGSGGSSKYENKDGIPRLFWFKKDMSLFEVYKKIITEYSFAQAYDDLDNHDPEAYF